MSFIYLALAFILNSAANILLKISSAQGFNLSDRQPLSLLANNFQFVVGLGLFATNVIFYYLALRSVPISVAYPVMVVMSFLLINSYAFFRLGEDVSIGQLIGYLMLVAGLILIFYFKK